MFNRYIDYNNNIFASLRVLVYVFNYTLKNAIAYENYVSIVYYLSRFSVLRRHLMDKSS